MKLSFFIKSGQNLSVRVMRNTEINWNGLIFSFRNKFTNIDYSHYQESGQWAILGSTVKFDLFHSTSTHRDLYFPAINYNIHFQRKPFYNTMYMVLPSCILSLVALLMFWLPPESGEKVSLGITVFLAFSVLMFSLSDDLPENSDSFPIMGKSRIFYLRVSLHQFLLVRLCFGFRLELGYLYLLELFVYFLWYFCQAKIPSF